MGDIFLIKLFVLTIPSLFIILISYIIAAWYVAHKCSKSFSYNVSPHLLDPQKELIQLIGLLLALFVLLGLLAFATYTGWLNPSLSPS